MLFVPRIIKNLAYLLFLWLIGRSKCTGLNKMAPNVYLFIWLALPVNIMSPVCILRGLFRIVSQFSVWEAKVGKLKFIILMISMLRVSQKLKLMIVVLLIFFSRKLFSIKGKMENYTIKSNLSHQQSIKQSKWIIIISQLKCLRKVLIFCLINNKIWRWFIQVAMK